MGSERTNFYAKIKNKETNVMKQHKLEHEPLRRVFAAIVFII